MHNLLEKFSPATDVANNDEGVVAIEYVLIAGFVAAGVAFVFSTTNLWQKLVDKLSTALA